MTLQAGAGDGVLADLRVYGPPLLALLQEGILDQRRNIEAGEVLMAKSGRGRTLTLLMALLILGNLSIL